MGGGSGPSQSGSQSGNQSSSSYGWSQNVTTPVLYNYANILPPWAKTAQSQLVPYLFGRAMQGGLTAPEKSSLWRTALDQVGAATDTARRGALQRIIGSGMDVNSPAAVTMLGDVENQRLLSTQKAATDFAKLRMGARDSALNQLITAAYGSAPFGIGYGSQSYGENKGSSQGITTGTTRSSGGGK